MAADFKKVLMVLYYFPPAASGGTYRPLKFIRYLREFGYQCVVIAPTRCRYESQDHSLLSEIPYGTEIIRVSPGIEESWHYNLIRKLGMGEIYEQSMVPDRHVGFAYNAIEAAKQRISRGDINLVFTSATPNSVHIAGREISKQSGLKWVADFRDPWIADPFYKPINSDRDKKNREIERSYFEQANAVISFPEFRADIERKRYPEYAQKIISIDNGFDPADFPSTQINHEDGKITISHVGAITKDRPGTSFLESLSKVLETDNSLRKIVNLDFYGDSRPPTPDDISRLNLTDVTHFNGYVPHSDACIAMAQSNLLFMVLPDRDGAEGIMPLRLFEYIYANRPVFLIAPQGEASGFLNESNSGVWVKNSDRNEITSKLRSILESIKSGQYKHTPNLEPLKKFERRYLTEKLAKLFDSLLKGGDVDAR
jgi:glycosyltransferase involved in cell wall biosynthesis